MKTTREAEAWAEMVEEVETESSGSSEAETESPRSVGRWVGSSITTGKEKVHSQVLKIREEDLCVLVTANLENRRCVGDDDPRRLSFYLISKPNLPCSPLSGKVRSVNAVQ